jgi:excisionase family DNA binding protein
MTTTNLPDFMTIRQTADELNCHPDTVAALIQRGELAAIRLGRAVRVVSASIQRLVEDGARSEGGARVERA